MLQLNPAQKAWQTRRLLAEARAKAEIAKATAIAAPSPRKLPLIDARVIEINLERTDVGCGWRRYVVLEVGDTWVKLFSAAQLLAIEIRRAEFDLKARAAKYDGGKILEIIRRNIALADRLNGQAQAPVMPDGGADAVRAMELIG